MDWGVDRVMMLLAGRAPSGRACAHALLERALWEAFGLSKLPSCRYGRLGKPYFPQLPQVHFSLSHSGELGLCAVSDQRVGVDIEVVRPRRPGLPRYALTREEYRWYETYGGTWEAFYTLWTRKESWCKREGGSILRPALVTPPLPGEAAFGQLRSFAGDGWRAAVTPWTDGAEIRWVEDLDPDRAAPGGDLLRKAGHTEGARTQAGP